MIRQRRIWSHCFPRVPSLSPLRLDQTTKTAVTPKQLFWTGEKPAVFQKRLWTKKSGIIIGVTLDLINTHRSCDVIPDNHTPQATRALSAYKEGIMMDRTCWSITNHAVAGVRTVDFSRLGLTPNFLKSKKYLPRTTKIRPWSTFYRRLGTPRSTSLWRTAGEQSGARVVLSSSWGATETVGCIPSNSTPSLLSQVSHL